MATESSPANPSYGYMWWLNGGARVMEGVPESVFYASGFGGNYIVIDRENRIVIVTRWLEPSKLGEFLKLVYNNIIFINNGIPVPEFGCIFYFYRNACIFF